MKTIFIVVGLAMLITPSTCYSQWAIAYGERADEKAFSVKHTSDNHYIVAGSSSSFGQGYDELWVLKLNGNGTLAWQKAYGTNYPYDEGYARSIMETRDGGYIVTGCIVPVVGGDDRDVWILKLNANGSVAWQKSYGGDKADIAYCIRETFDARGNPTGYIVAGETQSFGVGRTPRNMWVIKLNSNGTVAWQNYYSGSYPYGGGYARCIQQTSDGKYVVAGWAENASLGDWDVWVLKLNSDGNVVWEKTYGGDDDDGGNSIEETFDARGNPTGYIVAGETQSFGVGRTPRNMWVIKLNSNGTVAWQNYYSGSYPYGGGYARCIQQTSDGKYVVAGWAENASLGDWDVWVLKLNSDGNVVWEKTYGGDNDDGGNSIEETFDGKYIMVGETQSFGSGSNDIYVLRLDHNGDIPGCSSQSNVIVSGTSCLPGSAGVKRVETFANYSNTNTTERLTKAKKSVICEDVIQAEIIGTWDSGIWYWNAATDSWTKMHSSKPDGDTPSGDIAAGDFTGDGIADVASCWSSGLWYQNGATHGWTKVWGLAPYRVTAGDITGDGRPEIIGTWSDGIWYWNVVTQRGTNMTTWKTTGDIAAGDITGDGKADVASCWPGLGLYYQNGSTFGWHQITQKDYIPYNVAVGDMTGDGKAEVIGAFSTGIWYWNPATGGWRRLTGSGYVTEGDMACGDFNGDGYADLVSCWSSGLWIVDGKTGAWSKAYSTAPYRVTTGNIVDN